MTRTSPLHLALPAAAALWLAGCGKAGGSGTVRLSLAAVNGSPTAGALTAASAGSAVSTPMPAGSIASGPPDAMTIYVQEVSFRSGGGSQSVFKSSSPQGTAVTLTNQTIDLAQALGASTLGVPAGSYRGMDLTVSRVATAKGCVTGAFFPANAVGPAPLSGPILAAAPLHQGNLYSNDPLSGTHTFCTQAARSEVSVYTYSMDHIGSNAEFQASAVPATTEIDLDRGNPGGLTPAQIRAASVTLSTSRSFEVSAGQETRLLLAVDLNRMLRYFANTREDLQPPAPTMKAGTSYFFTSVFLDSGILAPADGTTIEGYQLVVTVNQPGQQATLAEWLTVVRGPDGKPLGGVVIPDDDNTLTVAKGSIDPAASKETSPGVWKLAFVIGTLPSGGGGSGSLDGFAFTAVGSSGSCGLTTFPGATVPPGTTFQVAYRRVL